MIAFVLILAGLLWVVALSAVAIKAVEAIDYSTVRACVLGLSALMMMAAPIAVMVSMESQEDPYSDRLCLRGHQEWRTSTSGRGGTSTYKVWVCEQWDAR